MFMGLFDKKFQPFTERPLIQDPRKQFLKKKHTHYKISCNNLCRGQIITEDAIKMVNHTKTLVCKSLTGKLLRMKVNNFYQRIKVHDETWKFLQQTNSQQLTHNQEKITKQMLFDKLQEKDLEEIKHKERLERSMRSSQKSNESRAGSDLNKSLDSSYSGGTSHNITHNNTILVMKSFEPSKYASDFPTNQVPSHITIRDKNETDIAQPNVNFTTFQFNTSYDK